MAISATYLERCFLVADRKPNGSDAGNRAIYRQGSEEEGEEVEEDEEEGKKEEQDSLDCKISPPKRRVAIRKKGERRARKKGEGGISRGKF